MREHIFKSFTAQDIAPVDVLNTSAAVVFSQTQGFIANKVFPPLPTDRQDGVITGWDKADFFRRQLKPFAARSRSAAPFSISRASNIAYHVEVVAAEAAIGWLDRINALPPLSPDRGLTIAMTQSGLIQREVDFVAAFLTTGIWGTDLTPSPLWSAGSSTPLEDIEVAVKTVLQNTGIKPNTLALGYQTWSILKNHAEILARVNAGQTPGGPAAVLPATIAALTGLPNVHISEAVQNTADEGQTGTFAFVAGKHAWVGFAAPNPSPEMPSAGYMVTLRGMPGADANGIVVTRWSEPDGETEMIRLKLAHQPKLISAALGYFFNGAVV